MARNLKQGFFVSKKPNDSRHKPNNKFFKHFQFISVNKNQKNTTTKENSKMTPDSKRPFETLSAKEFDKIKDFSKDKETPFLIIDLKKVGKKYVALRKNMPFAKVYYAVKANPANEVVQLLAKKGSNFDVASIFEIKQLLGLGIPAERMSYGNTIKKEEHIKFAFEQGIRLFATDCIADLRKIARSAPGSKVLVRLLLDNTGADWPLSRKFGTHPDVAFRLLLEAKKLDLIPYGISFHVGSQQRDIGQWDTAISLCKYLFDELAKEGIDLKAINLGGGFPANYILPTPEVKKYAETIELFLKEDFGQERPEVIIEPGRYLTGDSGVIVSEVIHVAKRSAADAHSWVYLDIGKFGGLIETLDESIKYPFLVSGHARIEETMPVILAGPTCDSFDILYEKFKYNFPKSTKEGDKVYILTTGAYTQSYSSVGFNGFPPLRSYFLK